MKRILKALFFVSIFFYSCSYSKFIMTGAPYPPLPEYQDVELIPYGDSAKYEEIGIAEIKDKGYQKRVDRAKKLARLHGGDYIMPLEDDRAYPPSKKEGKMAQSFRVLLKLTDDGQASPEDAIEKTPKTPEFEEPVEEKIEKSDYSNLPRVPFRILLGELDNLKGEKFKASMKPGKFINTPNKLKPYVGKNKIILELSEEKGGNALYLLVSKGNIEKIKKISKKNRRLKFVYTPVTVYNSKFPVIDLVYIIE